MTQTAAGQSGASGRAVLWYALDGSEVASALGVEAATGLSAERAAALLAAHGPNALPEEKPNPGWLRFIDQYRTYMQLILIGAAIVSAAVGEWNTAILLIALTLLNAVVGLRQEGKAESAMNALKSMMKVTARVRRGETEVAIPAEEVVVGDVVLLAAGDEVPADGRIIAATALQIDESALTGESVPAQKEATTLTGNDLAPGDQVNMAFMNTPVTHGSGVIIVTATAAESEMGKISGMLSATEAEQSPLTKELNTLTLWIVAAAALTMVVMFILGRSRNEPWDVLFVAAVSLAIAAIPEALPTVTQVILSLGSVELAKRNALVKELPAVETLGFTSAINSDKTGTLTLNQMTAVEVLDPTDRYTITGSGYGLEGRVEHPVGITDTIEDAIVPFLVANDATLVDGEVVGDPTEGALLVLGAKAGVDIEGTRDALPRLATLPFDPTYKLMATFHQMDLDGRPVVRCFVKGAAPAVMERSTTALSAGNSIPWDPDLAARAQASVERMAGAGQRVMAAAQRDIEPVGFEPGGDLLAHIQELQMTSLVGMVDPARAESKAAVAEAQAAHIRVRMITGDDVTTGAAIAKQVGIGGEAILGADFAAMSESERRDRIDGIGVLGRVAPEHKVLLVDTLKAKGEVVAMTGDGVNDAPAIKAADIGIAMGSGTEVAKSAARMILSDDNFATIVYAVEQGRKIFDNLTKYIRFVLVLLVVFVLTFLGAAIFNIAEGAPFNPAQVLWIHFFVNAAFGFALGFDLETPGLMDRVPKPRGESVLTPRMMVTVGSAGLVITVGLLTMIELGTKHFHSEAVGNSIAFTTFALCLVVAALECRSETGTILTTATFDSKQMNRALIIEVILAVLVTQMDALRRLLDTSDLNLREFGWALVPAVGLFILWELGKLLARRHAGVSSSALDASSGVARAHDEAVGMRESGDPMTKMRRKEYEEQLRRLQVELVQMQRWIVEEHAKVCIVFEGRDTAGKGGVIKRLTERVSPRVFRVVALPAPNERERSQMYFQRYIPHLPAAGEVVVFDRSWYNRAGVEPVMGFCTQEESTRFLELVPLVEQAIIDSGVILLKYWLEVSQDEQTRRLMARIDDGRKTWKLSEMDLKSYGRWYDYSRARDAMFAATDTEAAPWYVANSDDKRRARLNIISHVLDLVPYERENESHVVLPARQKKGDYREPHARPHEVPSRF